MRNLKKYQRGGAVEPHVEPGAPGAASASSHSWSATMKGGRNVTMKAKGGKVGNLKKGRK